MDEKYNSLKQILESLGKVVIAYSGGVDSTFLLKAAVDALGSENVLACIAVSASLGQSQQSRAVEMAEVIGANLRQIRLGELDDANYTDNKADRCFHCKSHLFKMLTDIAKEEKIEHVISGANFDDQDDYRPGNRAGRYFGVRAPMAEAELTKDDIRALSRQLGLATADIPASPCLASRIAYGLEITEERLKQVEEAEDFLRELGLVELRVRHHGDLARIEVAAEDIEKMTEKRLRTKIADKLKSLGFKYVTVDMQGFRSGAMNESLSEKEKRDNI